MNKSILFFVLTAFLASVFHARAEVPQEVNNNDNLWCQYEGTKGPGVGKHIVLIAGDDEYRSDSDDARLL